MIGIVRAKKSVVVGFEQVVTGAAVEPVVSAQAGQAVVAGGSVQSVVATGAVDPVVRRITVDSVAGRRALNILDVENSAAKVRTAIGASAEVHDYSAGGEASVLAEANLVYSGTTIDGVVSRIGNS